MNGKMTLEQFREIKRQLSSIIEQYDSIDENRDSNENTNYQERLRRLEDQYLEIQNRLLSNDLSDIPSDEWANVNIISDESHIADFSKTKANIDFSILEYSPYNNYKSCNIKNIEEIDELIDSNNFDSEVVKNNPKLFLSDSFPNSIKQKIFNKELTIEDLFILTPEQFRELRFKNINKYFNYSTSELVDTIGLTNAMELYSISKDDYKVVHDLSFLIHGMHYGFSDPFEKIDFESAIKKASGFQLKDIFYTYMRKKILEGRKSINTIKIDILPEKFVNDNKDILLIDENIPQDLRERYYAGRLTFEDIMNNIDLFRNLPVSKFTSNSSYQIIAGEIGDKALLQYIEASPEIMKFIIKGSIGRQFASYVQENRQSLNLNPNEDIEKQINDNLSPFIKSFSKLRNRGQLEYYDPSFFSLEEKQKGAVDSLGLENIRKFEKETSFFSLNGDDYISLKMLDALSEFLYRHKPDELVRKYGLDFKNGTLQYEDFLNEFAKCLDIMRKNNIFTDYGDYDWLKGDFRNSHPEIFISKDAPDDLRRAFYNNRIDPEFLFEHKDYIKYLIDKNLSNTIKTNTKLRKKGLIDPNGYFVPAEENFIDNYVSRYGNEKLLELISKYGSILSNIAIDNFNNEIDNEELLEQKIKESIYAKIINSKYNYSYLLDVPEIVSQYPNLFVDFNNLSSVSEEERNKLFNAFYDRNITYEDIRKYPELIPLLKDKNLEIPFGNMNEGFAKNILISTNNKNKNNDLELLQLIDNEKFLELCSKYGRYMNDIVKRLGPSYIIDKNNLDYNEITKRIENTIIKESITGNFDYQAEDAPDFLKEKHPELFLSDDAPEDLKKYFYNYKNNYPLTFEILHKNKEWLPFLKDKAITTSLLRNESLKPDMIKYFKIFGEDKAVKLGINRAETVKAMLKAHKVDLMKEWYDKTGGKFIPDFVVMQNLKIEDADKFLVSGSNWSNLMRIKSFSQTPEARDAMLKLAYSFGVFDQDQRGFKKLQDLLTGLPKKIDGEFDYIIDRIDKNINLYSQKNVFFDVKSKIRVDEDGTVHRIMESSANVNKEEAYQKMIEYIKDNQFNDLLDSQTLLDLLETLKKENVNIDYSHNIFGQLYHKNDEGSFVPTFNSQNYPKTAQVVREILERFNELPIVSPLKAHQLFGGFDIKYDPDFREFLLDNIDKIVTNPEYVNLIPSIQKQFSEIKSINSNRALTLDLAISYVQTNRYTSVEIGNEKVAEVSAIAGYSQSDFNILQQIYNYGKQRTFSSIPRIEEETEKISGKYIYQTLRLDDPLAMAIGTLTNCCQEINNCAELCMEHSMVDKNGRVFVIKDDKGNIVAQSWVWRNKDVLCFDNIEIPNKAFARTIKEYPELGRKGFTDEIYEIYKKAAHDLIEADEKVYKELLDSGKITQEQYDGLRLGKVTVGLGFNDIADSLQKNAPLDKGKLSRPLPFQEPVSLSRGLYTSDSKTQYILEEREDRKEYTGETLPVHNDSYIEYSDSNFNEKAFLTLEKLELATKGDTGYLITLNNNYSDPKHIISELAINYGLNPETSRIIMNPNFAIIYDQNEERIKIGDLLFNTKVDNEEQQMDIEDKVVLQMKLAFDQIKNNKQVDVSSLKEKQLAMYSKISGITDEIDIERGVGHAR